MNNFAKKIANKIGKRVRCLTEDTENCLSQTCNRLVDLSIHLLCITHEYIILGNFTSDPLEEQSGKLRQESRVAYFITVQQLLEKV